MSAKSENVFLIFCIRKMHDVMYDIFDPDIPRDLLLFYQKFIRIPKVWGSI